MILSCFNGSLRNNICFPRIYVADLSIHGKKTHGITWNQEDTINLVKVREEYIEKNRRTIIFQVSRRLSVLKRTQARTQKLHLLREI
ncbi:unnamed protein product [Brassica rapa subsp. narinosa]